MRRIMTLLLCAALLLALCAHAEGDGAAANDLGLYINEVYAAGEGDDWAEIINTGKDTVDLSGMGLSDDPARPMRWTFPAGTTLRANGLIVVTLIGKDADPAGVAGLWAGFAVSEGETLILSDANGRTLDQVAIGGGLENLSLGRAPGEDALRVFDAPTKGQGNVAEAYEAKLDPVTFSTGGACAEAEVRLELSAPEGATIRYTTDDTEPNANSRKYNGPLVLRENTRVRAYCEREGWLPSDVRVVTVLPGEPTRYRVVCVYGDAGDLKTGNKGNGKAVFAEAYDPDGTQLFAQTCLMKLSGHSSRLELSQKAFSLRVKDEYGVGWFDAPLFNNRGYERYKSVVMRSSGQDCNQTHMLDSILTSLAAATGVFYQETEVCTVFVNGEYWGIYNMRERVSPQSLAQFHGWDKWDNVNIVEDSGGAAYADEGSAEGYQQLLQWVRGHDLSSDAAVDELDTMMDVDNYLDYVALEMFVNNQDLDNVRCYNNPGVDGRWRWVIFDLDLAFDPSFKNTVQNWFTKSRVGSITGQDNSIFPKLMKNPRLREKFLYRMGELLDGPFSAENIIQKIEAREALLRPEMARNCERWGWSYETWEAACARLKDIARERSAIVAQELKKALDAL